MPKSMQAKPSGTLSTILQIDESETATAKAQLDATGVPALAEAYISGWTMADIAKTLRCSQGAVLQWEWALPADDKNLLRMAKHANLEQLEIHLVRLMQTELQRGGVDEPEPDGLTQDELKEWREDKLARDTKLANLTDKRIQSIQRVLSATQGQLDRYQKAIEKDKSGDGDVYVTQMIVSNEWLAALPDE